MTAPAPAALEGIERSPVILAALKYANAQAFGDGPPTDERVKILFRDAVMLAFLNGATWTAQAARIEAQAAGFVRPQPQQGTRRQRRTAARAAARGAR